MERSHSLLCIEKEAASSTCSIGTISSPCTESTLPFASRSLPPLHITEGQSHHCVEKTLSPLCGEGIGDAVCQHLYREEDTLFCVENTISPQYGEGVCLNHAIRRAQPDGSRPQVKRYTILVIYDYYTSTILTHHIACTEMQYVILCIEKVRVRTLTNHALESRINWQVVCQWIRAVAADPFEKWQSECSQTTGYIIMDVSKDLRTRRISLLR